jgi:hypothetical protein
MASITPNTSNSQALITPGWPLASVPMSNPIANNPGTTPGTNTTDTTDLFNAAAQAGETASRVI